MPKFNVMVTRTRTIESTFEIEVSAKDEQSAQEKIEEKVGKATSTGKLNEIFDWDEQADNDDFEYEVSEA